jgi:hypothetical protein
MLFENAVLEPGTYALLKRLGGVLAGDGFFLVGGTALAIQIGHRRSIDLDFFTRESFDPDGILEALSAAIPPYRIVVGGRAAHTLNLTLCEIKVDLIRYSYPLLEPLIEADGYTLLALPDIAAMKLAAITNRGSKKDFVDIYFLLNRYSIQELLGFYQRKFPDHDSFFVIRSLAYFEDAEMEPEPLMLQIADWNTVKHTVEEAVRFLA